MTRRRNKDPEKAKQYYRIWRAKNPDYNKNRTEEQKEKHRQLTRDWIKNHPDRYRNSKKKHHSKDFALTLYRFAKRRALIAKMEWDLTVDWIREQLIFGECPVTGFDFNCNFLDQYKDSRKHPFRPSIDRIDSKKGYTKDNCRVVCWMYNQAKYEWGDELLLAMAKGIIAHAPKN